MNSHRPPTPPFHQVHNSSFCTSKEIYQTSEKTPWAKCERVTDRCRRTLSRRASPRNSLLSSNGRGNDLNIIINIIIIIIISHYLLTHILSQLHRLPSTETEGLLTMLACFAAATPTDNRTFFPRYVHTAVARLSMNIQHLCSTDSHTDLDV